MFYSYISLYLGFKDKQYLVFLPLISAFLFLVSFCTLYNYNIVHSLFLKKIIKTSSSSSFYIVEVIQSPTVTLHRQRNKTVAQSVLPIWRPLKDWRHRYLSSTAIYRESELAKIMKLFLHCVVFFSAFCNAVFRIADNISKEYVKVKSDLKQFLWSHSP